MVETFLDDTRRRQAERRRNREAGHAAAATLQRLSPIPTSADPTAPTGRKERDWGVLGDVLNVGKGVGSAIGTALDVGNKYVTRPVLGATEKYGSYIGQGDPLTNALENIFTNPLLGFGMDTGDVFKDDKDADRRIQQADSFTGAFDAAYEGKPWQKLAIEATLDPLNLLGVGLVGRAAKIPKVASVASRSGVAKSILDNAVVFDDYLDRIQALPITVPLKIARKGINKAFPKALKQAPSAVVRGKANILRESAKQRGEQLLNFEGEIARQSDEYIAGYLNNDTIALGPKLTTLAAMTPAKLGRVYDDMAPGPLRDQTASLLSNEGLFVVDAGGGIRVHPDGTGVKTKKLEAYETVDAVADAKQLGEDERILFSGILDIVATSLYSSNPRYFPQLDDAYETAGKIVAVTSSDKSTLTPGVQGEFRGFRTQSTGEVGLSPISDITTLVHELLGHALAENMSPEDLARMGAYFGDVKNPATQEKFAEAIETFLRTGNLQALPTEVADVVSKYRQHASRINRQGVPSGQFPSGARGQAAEQTIANRIGGQSSQPQAPNPQFVTSTGGAAYPGQTSRLTPTIPAPIAGMRPLPGFLGSAPAPVPTTRTPRPPTSATLREDELATGQLQLDASAPFAFPANIWQRRPYKRLPRPSKAKQAGQQAARTIPYTPTEAPFTPMLGTSDRIDPRTLGQQAATRLPQPPATALPSDVTINVPGQEAAVPAPVAQVDAEDARNKLINYAGMDQATVDALTPQQTLDEMTRLRDEWTAEATTAADEIRRLRAQAQQFEAGTKRRTQFDPMIAKVRDRYNVLNAQIKDLTPAINDLETRLAQPRTVSAPLPRPAPARRPGLGTEVSSTTPDPSQPSLLEGATTPSGVPVTPGVLPDPTGNTADFLPYVSSYLRNAEEIMSRQESELRRLSDLEETAIDPADLDAVKADLDEAKAALRDAEDLAETNEGSAQLASELQQRLDTATEQIQALETRKLGQGPGLGRGLGDGQGEGLGAGDGGTGSGFATRERAYARVARRLGSGSFETFVADEVPDGATELSAMKAAWDEWTGFGRFPAVEDDVYEVVRDAVLNNAKQAKSRGGLKKDGTPKKPKGATAGGVRRITMKDLRTHLLGTINSNPQILAALHKLHREGVVSGLNNKGQVTLSPDYKFQDAIAFQTDLDSFGMPLSAGQPSKTFTKDTSNLNLNKFGGVLYNDPDIGEGWISAPTHFTLNSIDGTVVKPAYTSSAYSMSDWYLADIPNGMYYLKSASDVADGDLAFPVNSSGITDVYKWDATEDTWLDVSASKAPVGSSGGPHDPTFDTNYDLTDLSEIKTQWANVTFNPQFDLVTPRNQPKTLPKGRFSINEIVAWVETSPYMLKTNAYEALAAGEVVKRLGGKLNRSVRHYTSSGYDQMNAIARGEPIPHNGDPRTRHLTEDDWKTLTRELDEFIRQRPPMPTPLTLFRGVRVTGAIGEAIQHLDEPGTRFVEDGYTSASSDFGRARDFAGGGGRAYFRINVPEESRFAFGFPNEFEFILPRGAEYLVKDIASTYDTGGRIYVIDVDYLGSASTGEFSGSAIVESAMTLGNVESQFKDAIYQSKNQPLRNIFSTSDFGNRGGAQEIINTGNLPQSVDGPTTETLSPLRRDASTSEALNSVANSAGLQPGSTGEVFVKNLLTEHITENPTQFQAIELSSPRAAGMLADAMKAAEAGNDDEARNLTIQAMRRINQQQLSFGMQHPRLKKLMDVALPANKTLLNTSGTRAFGRHDQGTTLADRELEILAEARTIPSVVKVQEQQEKLAPLVEQTINDLANAGNPIPSYMSAGTDATTVGHILEASKFANANQKKVFDAYLKVFNGKRVDEQMTMREAFAETVVTKYHAAEAKRLGIPYDKAPTGLGKVWMNLTKGWREQALFSVRYHAVNALDLQVRSSIYGVNPTLGRAADRRAQRWGMEIPHDIEIKGYEAEGLREGLNYDERAGPALGKLPVIGKALDPAIRWNRKVSKLMENSARKAGWAKTVEDHLQQQIMPRMGEEIDRVAITNAAAIKEMLTLSEGNLSAQMLFDGVIAKGGSAEQATELSTLWSRGLNEASDRGREFSNAVYFNYSSDVRNIEETLRLYQFLPFHFWATRNIPFYLDTLAANPELARLWQTYDQISDDEREDFGLTQRVQGMLPIGNLPDLLFGPGTGYFNPLVALSLADQTKPRYTPEDATGVGRLLNEAGRAGLGPAPWVVIPLTIIGAYGDRAEAPDPLRHSRLTGTVLENLGLPTVAPVKSAVRGAQEFVTGKEQFTFTGSTYKDRAVATRLAEMSIEDGKGANHPEYVFAAADPKSPLFQKALADVNRSQLKQELYGFTSPLPLKMVRETEQAIRSDRMNLEQQYGGQIPPDAWQQLADQGVLGTGYSRFGGDARGRQVFAGFSALDGIPRTRSALREQQTNEAFPFYAQYLLWLQTQPAGADTSVDAFTKAT